VRPRRLIGTSGRPLNFTVRRHVWRPNLALSRVLAQPPLIHFYTHMKPQHVSARIACLLAIALFGWNHPAFATGTSRIPGIDGKSVVLVRRPDPGFELVTSSGSALGAFAALGPGHVTSGRSAMQEAGRQLIADDQIQDPAVALGAALLVDMADTYKLKVVDTNAAIVADDKQLESFRKQNPADLILEFHTEAWRTYYFLDFKHYDVSYHAKARLIDGRNGSVVRQAKCAHKPSKSANSPTIDELLADNGAKLRTALEAAEQLCMATVKEEFGIYASP